MTAADAPSSRGRRAPERAALHAVAARARRSRLPPGPRAPTEAPSWSRGTSPRTASPRRSPTPSRTFATSSGGASDGLEVAVTGPAGYSADAIKVFEQIDGSLVGAAFLLVFVLLIFIYRSPILLWFPLLAVAFAEIATRGLGWVLTEAGVTVNGQSS